MNKITTYLNQHVLGEVSNAKALRKRFSRDGSVLTMTPEFVVFPRVTNDIRKVARFAWQLAEKGHPMGVTVRGSGTDTTGAAIGKGLVLSTSVHLNNILHISLKDRLAHVQPGVTFETLANILKWHGLAIPNVAPSQRKTTIGGAIASNSLGVAGDITGAIDKLEIVLSNGDMIETGRISHREVSKKLGLQTLEGEIYRKLEGLIEDNEELIKTLAADPTRDNAGYKNIAAVRDRDGSFDLTPLFIGSQGTLGIISEVVLKADFFSQDQTILVATLADAQAARDLADQILHLEPSAFEIFDGSLFAQASNTGTEYSLLGNTDQLGAVIYVAFNDFSDRAQAHKLKKLHKLLTKIGVGYVDSTDSQKEEFEAVLGVSDTLQLAASDDKEVLPLIDGSFIPPVRREEFIEALAELAHKHHINLPLRLNVLTGTFYTYPTLKLDIVSDKQKLFRLLTDYSELVHKCDGAFVSDGAEGRLKAPAAWALMDDNEVALYEQVRQIFDPFNILNPGVKQKTDIRTLVAALRTSYDVGDFL